MDDAKGSRSSAVGRRAPGTFGPALWAGRKRPVVPAVSVADGPVGQTDESQPLTESQNKIQALCTDSVASRH